MVITKNKIWQEYSEVLRSLLELDYSPVALSQIRKKFLKPSNEKIRVCRAILDSGKGKVICLNKTNNACFGAAWHMGFYKMRDPKIISMVKRFIVEGEKLFSSYKALDNLINQFGKVPDNTNSYFVLSPLEKHEFRPDLVIFIVNPEVACRILTFVTFTDGIMPRIKVGGPTCRMSITYPLQTGEVNLSFYDYTARKMCNLEKDKLIISIPYNKIPVIIKNIDKCSAGKAKLEFPQELREFLQKRLSVKQN
jgi:uncharacterized protein (DUF169 family)